jgi:hypothetical protein
MNLHLLGSMARGRIVASVLVMRHRQIPVIQQLSAVTNRAAWRSTSTLAVVANPLHVRCEAHAGLDLADEPRTHDQRPDRRCRR